MTTDRDQKQSDRARRRTNAFAGGIVGAIIPVFGLALISPSVRAAPAIIIAVVVGTIGAVVGWCIPKAAD